MLLIASPGITASVAVLTATAEPVLALAITFNVAAGVAFSSLLFIGVSLAAARVANDRIHLVQATEQAQWRARAQQRSINSADGLFAVEWYFRLRIDEEIGRAERYRLTFSVLRVQPARQHRDVDINAATSWFGTQILTQLRGSDLPAVLADGSVAVLLPHTPRETAVRARLQRALANSACRIGMATYPDDGPAVDDMLRAATQDAERPAEEQPKKKTRRKRKEVAKAA